jgi:hypothetical protein
MHQLILNDLIWADISEWLGSFPKRNPTYPIACHTEGQNKSEPLF